MSLQPKQFQQLQMFMKPSEVSALPEFEFGDRLPGESEEWLRQNKLGEADSRHAWSGDGERSLHEQIKAEGVKEPIEVSHGVGGFRHGEYAVGTQTMLRDGHHRFFTQERRERAGEEVYLPVIHRRWGGR